MTKELIAELRAKCDGRIPFVIHDDNIRTLLDHIAALEAVLEPFAARAFQVDGLEDNWFCQVSVQVKHLRAAARVRSPISGGGT